MNDQMRVGGAMAPTSERRTPLAEIIISSLSEITDGCNNVNTNISELESYLFGDKPSDKGNEVTSNPEVECWENEVLRKLENIKFIVSEQQNTLETISRFHK